MIIQSKRIWLLDQFIEAQIEIKDKKILAIYPYQSKPVDIDYGNYRIIPGMIDIHCHGGYGYDTNDEKADGLSLWASRLPSEGVTTFLPTTVTQSKEVLSNALKNVATYMEEEHDGAQVYGIHFEGPYLNLKYKGAQPEEYIKTPDVKEFEEYQKIAKGNIRIVTIATEEDTDYQLTRYASGHNVIVSIGHSNATYQQAIYSIANGAKSMTHLYNGMTGLHHREPGLVGAAMRMHQVYGEIICDGNHVSWPAIHSYVTNKGNQYAIMVSDSLRCKGQPKGVYDLGGQPIEVHDNGSAYLLGTNTLAGSTLRFNEGLKNLIEKVELPVVTAINMVSKNPATLLGIENHKGSILAGYDADLVVLDDNYHVIQTYVSGKQQIDL